MWRYLAVAVAVFSLCSAARAAEPTSKPVDLSSPRAALKSLAEALKAGDAKRAGRACLVTADEDKKFVDVNLKFEAALEKLAAAVEQKFGEGSSVPLREQLDAAAAPTDAVPSIEKAASEAPESSSEDSVTVSPTGSGPFKITRVDGDWKLDVSEMLKDMPAEQRQQAMRQLPKATKKLEKVNEQFSAGKITSVDELTAAMKAK
jgi:hypothetical protein